MLKTVHGSKDTALSYVILGFIDPRRDASSSPALSMKVGFVVQLSVDGISPLIPCVSSTKIPAHESIFHYTQSQLDIAGKQAE